MARRKGRSNKQAEARLNELEAFMRDGVLDGRLVPGQRLVESDLMVELGASRWEVREVLRRIEVDGLIGIERNRGAMVRKISRKEVLDVLDILDTLSVFAIEQCIARMDRAATRKLIAQSLNASRQFRSESARRGQAQDYLYENARFWQTLAEAADNPTLAGVKFKLQMRLFCIQRQGLDVEATRDQWIALHEELLGAILERDTRRAVRLAREASDDVRAAIMALPDVAFAGAAKAQTPAGRTAPQ